MVPEQLLRTATCSQVQGSSLLFLFCCGVVVWFFWGGGEGVLFCFFKGFTISRQIEEFALVLTVLFQKPRDLAASSPAPNKSTSHHLTKETTRKGKKKKTETKKRATRSRLPLHWFLKGFQERWQSKVSYICFSVNCSPLIFFPNQNTELEPCVPGLYSADTKAVCKNNVGNASSKCQSPAEPLENYTTSVNKTQAFRTFPESYKTYLLD